MRKVNTNNIPEEAWSSPKGKFVGFGKEISEELGRKPRSTDLNERHPFDVEVCRIPPRKDTVSLPFAQCTMGILSHNFRAGPRATPGRNHRGRNR